MTQQQGQLIQPLGTCWGLPVVVSMLLQPLLHPVVQAVTAATTQQQLQQHQQQLMELAGQQAMRLGVAMQALLLLLRATTQQALEVQAMTLLVHCWVVLVVLSPRDHLLATVLQDHHRLVALVPLRLALLQHLVPCWVQL